MSLNPDCNFDKLTQLMAQMAPQDRCERIGKTLCASGHYFNMYKVYYCHLSESKWTYMLFVFAFFAYMMLNLNYIRRTYFIQHIQALRKSLHLPDFVAESILLPVSYGVVPIFIRIIASYTQVDFHFQTGANLGACLALITLFTGMCAMKIGVSPPVDMEMFFLNTTFVILGNLLHLPLGFRKVVNRIDGILYLLLFSIYMVCRFFLARRKEFKELENKKKALVEGRPKALDSSSSIMKGMLMIVQLQLRVEAVKAANQLQAEPSFEESAESNCQLTQENTASMTRKTSRGLALGPNQNTRNLCSQCR
jgi:Ca2+/Na+ antiporter